MLQWHDGGDGGEWWDGGEVVKASEMHKWDDEYNGMRAVVIPGAEHSKVYK